MALGYVLITTKPGTEKDVYSKLTLCKDIIELHPLFGEYDMIAKITADDVHKLGKIVVDNIRTIDDVMDTKTLTALNF